MKILVLASGAGTTFKFLALKAQAQELNHDFCALVVDRDCEAVSIAEQLKIPFEKVIYKTAPQTFGARLYEAVKKYEPDLILSLGFLRKIPNSLLMAWPKKVLNSHPSLLPKHGGPGLYGRRVHESVKASADLWTGVTLHEVTENYDEGPIVSQLKIKVEPEDSALDIENKVKNKEKEFLFHYLKSGLELKIK